MRELTTCTTMVAVCQFVFLLWTPGTLYAQGQQTVLATVAGQNITEADIAGRIEGQMVRINQQIYTAKKQAVDSIIAERLLDQEAQKRGISREQLLQQEVNAKAGTPSDAEVEQFYNANKAQLGNKPLAEVKPQIVQRLQSGKQQEQQQAYIRNLRKAAGVKVQLQPPVVQIALAGAPVQGPATAPVTIVEFSDYQ
jgi:SurA-like N-terminal domain